ncbi:hypothetical protein SUGI_0695240 [Cryptomeria japonica]|nr:hypothetical protein SUGI_0695240 [Cryptomeria japonica]
MQKMAEVEVYNNMQQPVCTDLWQHKDIANVLELQLKVSNKRKAEKENPHWITAGMGIFRVSLRAYE